MSTSDQCCDYLFLSPHLDDVVLSCALRLLREIREKKTVCIATVFSRSIYLLPDQDLYKGRRCEDELAQHVLGVNNPVWLGFRDAPFRHLFYTNFRSIILGKHPTDRFNEEDIVKNVSSLCLELEPQTIFIPLAIGTHIDHRLTHKIWASLPSNTNIIFYEDRPYVFLPHSLELRLREIGANIPTELQQQLLDNPYTSIRTFAKGLKETTLYKNVLTAKRDRYRYLLWAKRQMKPLTQKQNLKIEPQIITTNSAEEVSQIEKAIFTYKSQMKLLYKNPNIFKQESTAYAHQLDANSLYAERYWKLLR